MTIPALATSDKLFICSYNIGSNVDFRLASGVMNEITTYTTEYIEGKCWIPVLSPQETNDHSYFWDEVEKDVVYVKVGCRVSVDGYIHTWLTALQKPSELILWNNKASSVGTPINDTTVLHWSIEKIYRNVWGSVLGFNASNIKFQTYISGATRLYLCGVNSTITVPNIILDPVDVKDSSVSWFPNNIAVIGGDLLTSNNDDPAPKCTTALAFSGTLGIATVAMGTSPQFVYISIDNPSTMDISRVCQPGDAGYSYKTLCTGNIVSFNAIGNNSGRDYTIYPYGGKCIGCNPDLSNSTLACDLTPNQSYIWVDSYCSGASGGSQSVCEGNGGTWIPGHYECNPSFTYDAYVSFVYRKWNSISPTISDFGGGRFYFASLDDGSNTTIQASYTTTSCIDMFSELEDDDRDWVKHFDFTPYINLDINGIPTSPPYNNQFYTGYTKVIGIGVLTDNNGATISSSDWIITWSGANYFTSWQTPDGLSVRNPGAAQTLLDRPLTHHDEFYTGATDIEGGFIFDTATSNAFSSRNPGTETRLTRPVHYNTDFDWMYEPNLSDGFLDRTIDIEDKLDIPICGGEGFCWIYTCASSNAFIERSIATEIKVESPVCNNTGFNWLYKMVEPQVSKYRFLKTTGNNTLDGKTWANAWKTWSYAMSTLSTDSKLFAMDGHYTGETAPSPQEPFELVVCDAAGTDETPAEVKITEA